MGYVIDETRFTQDANRSFYGNSIAKEAIDAHGINQLPATKKEARSLFPVNKWFDVHSGFEVDDEQAERYIFEREGWGQSRQKAIREVKSRIKKELKRSFIQDRENKLNEIYD